MLRLEAYERFKKRLMDGDLKPGTFVNQRELAKLIGVPLSPAREAIQRLEFESLLKVHPQRGVQVVAASPKMINDAYDLRRLIELDAVVHFAAEAPAASIERLRAETLAVRETDDPAVGVEVDWRMHDEIVDAQDNAIISELFRINACRIRLARNDNRPVAGRMRAALSEHLDILDACARRDGDGAARSLCTHIETSRNLALGRRPS